MNIEILKRAAALISQCGLDYNKSKAKEAYTQAEINIKSMYNFNDLTEFEASNGHISHVEIFRIYQEIMLN